MEEKVWQAALAGLLHDIGKLEQRARSDPWKPAPSFEDEGQPVHATWSGYFIQTYVPERYRPYALPGTYHHQPDRSPASDNRLSLLVALADKLSAGERADVLEKDRHPPQQLITIFDRLERKESQPKDGWHYLPLAKLSLHRHAIFPSQAAAKDLQTDAYAALCEEMRSAARLDIIDPQSYLENLLGAMQRATWSVPSAYYHSIPDVSLYDHSRMTAALAVCLAGWPADELRQLHQAVTRNFTSHPDPGDEKLLETPVASLIGGDISGIQDFIYTISSKSAAKTLRGRSFYLQLLTEAVLRYVLSELELPYTNVIYSGGGHFFLLAPSSAQEKLTAIQQVITRKLIRHHSTDLYLAIGSATVPAHGFKIGQFPAYWGEMHRNLSLAKGRRYTELDDEMHAVIFQVKDTGGNPEASCSVCGDDRRPVKPLVDEREEQARICSLCSSFDEQIGRKLPESSTITLGLGQAQDVAPDTAADALRAFGLQFQFLKAGEKVPAIPGAERVAIWAFDDPPGEEWSASEHAPASRFIRYTVNRIPRMTFDELQERVEGGFKRLGVLRMDVDNLGEIFAKGFGSPGDSDNRATLARLSTLSFQMSLFFEGWVKRLAEADDRLVYAVYAGGDDLFLIGPWDQMPGLARDIRADFDAYTASNPALTLSGGMTFIDGKYPVYQAARDAEQAERRAKNLQGKNAFTFLGIPWIWPIFERLADKRARLEKLVSSQEQSADGLGGPQAVLHVLQQLAADEAQATRQRGRPVWGRWMWRGAYQLKRMSERQKGKPALATELDAIREELSQSNYGEINQWGTAARWLQLYTRSISKEKE